MGVPLSVKEPVPSGARFSCCGIFTFFSAFSDKFCWGTLGFWVAWGLGVGAGVFTGAGVALAVGVGVGAAVGFGVGSGDGSAEGLGVGVGVGEAVASGLAVGVAGAVGAAVSTGAAELGASTFSPPQAERPNANASTRAAICNFFMGSTFFLLAIDFVLLQDKLGDLLHVLLGQGEIKIGIKLQFVVNLSRSISYVKAHPVN